MAQNRTRTKQIIIRMTDDEYAAYEKRLAKSDLSGNSFGIKCLLNHEINVIENMPELIRNLKLAGNNLNQIARVINSNKSIIMPSQVNENLSEMSKGVNGIWQWLKFAKVGGH